MNWFQIVAISLLVLFLLRELLRIRKRGVRPGLSILPILIALAAGLAILFPDSLTTFAHWLGIGRGADVLLYCSVLFFAFLCFTLYTRILRLERRQTELVRELALLHQEKRP